MVCKSNVLQLVNSAVDPGYDLASGVWSSVDTDHVSILYHEAKKLGV